jgi:peptidoglycan/LPS O-acetylase OafA/YrhL
MIYRAEIDGLRALALVPVVFYHAGFDLFRGGFVGVDIFFVISGYLIARIIILELYSGTFSILNFYERRARRILPALFLMFLTFIPFAWFWLSPSALRSFSESLIAASTFISNIYFYKTSGYFEAANETKPLIHTWSLSLEEQFYVIFPIFLMITWRIGRRLIFVILLFVFIISLTGAHYFALPHPSFNFYMLPTRVWELLIGVFIAIYFSRRGVEVLNFKFGYIACSTGIFFIIFSVIFYSDQTPYPSLYTLVPTLGAALILMFATPETFVGKVLSSKILVGIGLISYSSYLWHQPIFAFSRVILIDNPSKNYKILLIGIIFIISYFSWKYIEKPFRHKEFIERKIFWFFTLFFSILFIIIGYIGYKSLVQNMSRYTDTQKEYLFYFENSIPDWNYFTKMDFQAKYRSQCDFYDINKFKKGNSTKIPVKSISTECYIKNSNSTHTILLWGDSHAQQLYPGLNKYLSKNWQILQITSSGCISKLNQDKDDADYCKYSNWFAYKVIKETMPDIVLIGQNIGHNIDNMEKISNKLKSHGINKIIFTGPTPHWKNDLPNIVVDKLWSDIPQRSFVGIDQNIMNIDNKIKSQFSLNSNSNYDYLSIIDNFCNIEGCLIYIGDDRYLGITSWDYGHLTPIASEKFSKEVLVPLIESYLK